MIVYLKVLPWEALVEAFTGSPDLYGIVDTAAAIEGMPTGYIDAPELPPLVSIEATDTSLVLNYGQAAALLEPIRKLLELNESDVIPYWALDSFGSARCGSLNTAVLRIATAFVIRVI